jgi:radical SAM protein with 4Fe4S-binding SPASM domain
VFLHHFGESLLHPKLGEFIGYARDHGIQSYLSANPVLLTEPRVRALVDNGLHELVLSLDGVTSETSAAVRGRAAQDVELAEARIRSLVEYRRQAHSKNPIIILQIVRQKQNVHEVEEWLRKWKGSPGIDRVKVKSFVTWNGRAERINRLRLEPEPDGSAVVCDKPWTSITILWDGRVVPCCFDYDGILTLGHVGEQTLEEIWQGERIHQLRSSHRDRKFETVALCAKCKDKEGYAVKKWYYPLNRILQQRSPLGDEWRPNNGAGAKVVAKKKG